MAAQDLNVAALPLASGAEGQDSLDHWSRRNPILCWLCDGPYEDPCLLNCYHTFCARCLRPRVVDSKISCPLCGKITALVDGHLPPRDNLMVLLVESSCEERPTCANCDKSNQTAMFFCNTCGQALCGHCREETHRARMFSLHDIIHMSKRGREISRKCTLHGEPYIMFSTTKRSMLCINCFQESSMEARLHCIDLDTAYTQGSKKLERAVALPGDTLIPINAAYAQARQRLDRAAGSIRELQGSVRDGVFLFKKLLDELRKNMETEKHNITSLSDALQEALKRTHDSLLREVDGQYEIKDRLFRNQLASLGALLPIIQVHLLMCTTFASSTSKFEFLDIVFQLMERLAAIAHLSHPLRPGQSSQIRSNFKSEFSRSLEPLLSITSKCREYPPNLQSGCSGERQQSGDGAASRPTSAASAISPPAFGMPGSKRSLSAAKLKVIESGGPFAEHCKAHETSFRELTTKFTRLKEEAQELHRDVTIRRCLTRRGRVEEIVRECATLEDEFRVYADQMEELRAAFDSSWDDQVQRVYAEQEIFQSQVNDVVSLRDENKRLMMIAQQLEPYIRSISSLMERISPKLQVPQSVPVHHMVPDASNDGVNAVMQQILDQINSCKTEHHTRSESSGGRLEDTSGTTDIILPAGIPRPPDPPHSRKTPPERENEQESEQGQGFSPELVYGRVEGAHTRNEKYRVGQTVSPNALLTRSAEGRGFYQTLSSGDRHKAARRKRQNSEGDSLIWQEMEEPAAKSGLQKRRGSEGSEVEIKRSVIAQILEKVRLRDDKRPPRDAKDYESDADNSRGSSRERRTRSSSRGSRSSKGEVQDLTERLIDQSAAAFDASAVPERPKSACENTLLRAAEKLYYAPSGYEHRSTNGHIVYARPSHSREHSAGRTSSEERDQVRVSRAPRLPHKSHGVAVSEVQAIVHADYTGRKVTTRKDADVIYSMATVPRKYSGKKENIYENVVFIPDSALRGAHYRPLFKKQSSLESLPSEGRGRQAIRKTAEAVAFHGGVKKGTLRKADSFEGHEEAVRTLVAAVQENRMLRRKKTK